MAMNLMASSLNSSRAAGLFYASLILIHAGMLCAVRPVCAQPPAAIPSPPFALLERVEGTCDEERSPFDNNGSAFVTWSNGAARVWNARTLAPLTKPLIQDGAKYVRLSGNGKVVLTADDQKVRLWDVPSSKLLAEVQATHSYLRTIDINPDGTRFVAIDEGDIETAAVWQAGRTQPRFSARQQGLLTSAEFDPTGTYIVTHAYSKAFAIWTADAGQAVCPPIESDDRSWLCCRAQFDSTGRRLVLPQDRGFTLIETSTGKLLSNVTLAGSAHADRVRFSGDGKKLAVTTSNPGPVQIYDAAAGKWVRELGSDVFDCQISPEGRWALCTPLHRTLADVPQLWDIGTGREVQSFAHGGSVAWMSPDGTVILVMSGKDKTEVWGLRRGTPETRP